MKIRTKFSTIFLLSSLLPLIFVGSIAYRQGEKILKKNISMQLTEIADRLIQEIDSFIYFRVKDMKNWANLELMNDVLTGDLDGEITKFFIQTKANYGIYSGVHALNNLGEVVASSSPELIGKNYKETIWFKRSIRGELYIEDITYNEIIKDYGLTFSLPIKTPFEEERPIGVLCSNLKWDELYKIIQRTKIGEQPPTLTRHIELINKEGLLISGSEIEKNFFFKKNIKSLGLTSAHLASLGQKGSLIETTEHNIKALIVYAPSKGYQDFKTLGWSILVSEDIKEAFLPIRLHRDWLFGMGLITALISLIFIFFITKGMIRPIYEILKKDKAVALGSTEDIYTPEKDIPKDEIGEIMLSRNQMLKSLQEARIKLQDYSMELEKRVEEKTKQLEQTQAQLIQSEKLAAIGELAAGVSHEIANPLNVISGRAKLISMEENLNEETKESLKIIRMQSEKINQIIDRLSKFARRDEPKQESININNLIDETLPLLEYQIRLENIKIVKDYAQGLPKISGDRNQLQEVFLNILLNAVQAMPNGGNITIKTSLERITEYGIRNGRRKTDIFKIGDEVIVIEFTDTGSGIPKEYLDRIFEPFFTTKSQGTGLGLSVSYGIIETHRGSIYVKSDIERGTTFVVRLPKA